MAASGEPDQQQVTRPVSWVTAAAMSPVAAVFSFHADSSTELRWTALEGYQDVIDCCIVPLLGRKRVRDV